MVELSKPTLQLLPSYLEFIEELRANGEKIWDSLVPRENESPKDFVARLLGEEDRVGPSLVPQSNYWGVLQGGMVVGRIVLRHQLTEKLQEFGGHISYEVRPSFRRRGIAKEMLRQLLQTPKAKQIGRLLLTCAPNNAPSNKTITANHGLLARTAYVAAWNRDTNYYWIDLNRVHGEPSKSNPTP